MTRRPRLTPVTASFAALACLTLALSCMNSGKTEAGAPGVGGMAGANTIGAANARGGASATGGSAGSTAAGSANGAAGSANPGAAGSTNPGAGAGGIPSGTGASGGSSEDGARSGSGGTAAGAGAVGTGGAGIAGGAGGAGGAPAAQWSGVFPKFTKRTIASFSAGYAMVVADIDHDGLKDVVALSSSSAGLVWFKNPSWTKYTVTTRAKQLIHTAPYDVDGDGDLDLALISDFNMNDSKGGGTISWAECPADPTREQEWSLHAIDAVPTSHRLRWADIDGDGRKELINLPLFGEGSSAPAHMGAVELAAYAIPRDPRGAWTGRVLDDTHLEVSHGVQIVDWDGDKAEDILTAANDGIDLFRPALSNMPTHLGAGKDGQAPNRGSSEVALGHLAATRFIATIEPWHGTDAVIYTPGASAAELWTRQVIGSEFEHGHALATADLNADGYDEVIGGGGQGALTQLIYRYLPSSRTWEAISLDVGGVAVSAIDVTDLNGDGALDIVAIGGSPTNNVVWYESAR